MAIVDTVAPDFRRAVSAYESGGPQPLPKLSRREPDELGDAGGLSDAGRRRPFIARLRRFAAFARLATGRRRILDRGLRWRRGSVRRGRVRRRRIQGGRRRRRRWRRAGRLGRRRWCGAAANRQPCHEADDAPRPTKRQQARYRAGRDRHCPGWMRGRRQAISPRTRWRRTVPLRDRSTPMRRLSPAWPRVAAECLRRSRRRPRSRFARSGSAPSRAPSTGS